MFHQTIFGVTQHSKLTHTFDKTPDAIEEVIIPTTAVPVDIRDWGRTWKMSPSWKQHLGQYNTEAVTAASTVRDLLPAMQPWEKSLLANLEVTDATENSMWEKLCSERCYIATDGSAKGATGSFGWVISDSEGNVLAKCFGPVYGAKVSSYRAEAYGLLSAFRYLARLSQLRQQVHGATESILSQPVICDNKGIVDRVTTLRGWTIIYPNVTMEPEWDVIAEIRTALGILPQGSQPTIEHIESHQDDNQARDKLPLKSQLNCIADDLTKEYYQKHPDSPDTTRVPLLPTSGCQIHLPHGTTTRDLKRELKLARTIPPMRAKTMPSSRLE
jgi:hypothetical protein